MSLNEPDVWNTFLEARKNVIHKLAESNMSWEAIAYTLCCTPSQVESIYKETKPCVS